MMTERVQSGVRFGGGKALIMSNIFFGLLPMIDCLQMRRGIGCILQLRWLVLYVRQFLNREHISYVIVTLLCRFGGGHC
ncbi:hypothetical protein LINPERHAP2_LOCUS16778 [Linum perenne]